MSKHLVVLGHGRSKAGVWDPGARGNGTSEAEWLSGPFLDSLKKYADNTVDFYEQNMFANRSAATIKAYDQVTELHLDGAAASVKGGHVIIYGNYKPDELDRKLGAVIEKHFGLRGGRMFDNRTNLYNLNTFARRGISYRLLELGFITNKENMDYFKANYDTVARELMEVITGKKIQAETTVQASSNTKSWSNMTNREKYNEIAEITNVKQLQERLSKAGYSLTVDGKAGPETLRIIQQFQRDNDLSSSSGSFYGRPGPSTLEALKKVASKKQVHLPRTASTWRTYRLDVQPITRNSDWSLTPSRFGGLTYDILDEPYQDVVTIETSRGKRNIFVGSSTGAVIK